jgi:hypothetical protein
MVGEVPGAELGVLVCAVIASVLGYWTTSTVLGWIAKRRTGNRPYYADNFHPVEPVYLTKRNIRRMSVVGGGLAVGLAVLLLLMVLREYSPATWAALTGIGMLGGIATFFLSGSQSEPGSDRKQPQTTSTNFRPRAVGKPRPTTPTRTQPRPREDPYRELLARVLHDRGVADRLVEYERKRTPDESFDELCRSAILRWQRDNR